MKRVLAAVTSLTLLVGSAGLASAQPFDPGRGPPGPPGGPPPGFGGPGGPPPPGYGGPGGPGGPPPGYDRGGPRHDWRRGDRIDRDQWDNAGRIDYRQHHLRPPPRGYQWREIDGRYVLGAIATGVIADIFLNQR